MKSLMGWRLAAIAGVTLAAAALFYWLALRASQEPMALLFSGLDSRDSSEVVQRLEAANVSYELKGDGSTILVPADQALKLRMTLAGDGVPAGGGVGYEIFDKQDALGVTSFQQDINKKRALEGELARTIRSLDRVEQAKVHLSIPERKLFTDNAAAPTAAVVIRVRGGRLAPDQVEAVRNLIASAVEGLSPQRVTVVDEKGELLAGGQGDDSSAAIQSALDARRAAYEDRIRRQVEGIVANVVGAGRVRVEVAADIDFNRSVSEKTTYDPDGQVIRSVTSRSSNADATNKNGANAVTVGTNLPDPNAAGGSGGDNSRETNTQADETTNYEISSVKETTTKDGGAVKRLSVAVAVDGNWNADAGGARTYQARSDEDMKKIEGLVRSAVGIDDKRGDSLQVVNMQFAQEEAQTLTPEEQPFLGLTKADIMKLVELGVMALIALLAILLVFRPMIKRLLAPIAIAGAAVTPAGALPGSAPPVMVAGPDGVLVPAALPAPGMSSVSQAEVSARIGSAERMIDIAQVDGQVSASSVKKVGEIVSKHPEEAVAIMRQWMHDPG